MRAKPRDNTGANQPQRTQRKSDKFAEVCVNTLTDLFGDPLSLCSPW
jgi:hypothetical protein